MCAIAGIVSRSRRIDEAVVVAMRDTQTHRGPDDCGLYVGEGVGLGHRRLSIIDLTDAGRQPMTNEDHSLFLVFNGEIFNYIELREQLRKAGHVFRTASDSEVILHAYEEFGASCVSRFNGMFAFALWNTRDRSLFLARDRMGIKPLSYAADGDTLAFASETKALLHVPGFSVRPNYNAIRGYWETTIPVDDATWFEGASRLMPGHWALWKDGHLQVRQYWDPEAPPADRRPRSVLVKELRSTLDDAVELALRSDVPVGTHLSGGIDSSLLTALASLRSPVPVKTYSGRYAEGEPFDEGRHIQAVVQHCGTDGHDVFIRPSAIPALLDKAIWHMDYPMAGPGMIPQFEVCRLTRDNRTKVVLGGQGGDELFAGYFDNYQPYLQSLTMRFWQRGNLSELRSAVSTIVGMTSGERMRNVLDQRRNREKGRGFLEPDFLRRAGPLPASAAVLGDNPIQKKLYWDLRYRLPALLQVEDRLSMAASLESRVPLLDNQLVDFAVRLPVRYKITRGETKSILREAVRDVLPASVLNRRDKVGFTLPLADWFGGPLREFVHDSLSSRSFRERGIVTPEALSTVLNSPSPSNWLPEIWRMLCIDSWCRTFLDTPVTAPPASMAAQFVQ